jgi:glycosyltransferase involved in cell wall biosynthesis
MNPAAGRRPSILFISALDFKERSIQVIRKTPEAFRDGGWEVTYLAARETSKAGDYFYERVFDPPGIRVARFSWPLAKLQDKTRNKAAGIIISKLRSYLTVAALAARAGALTLGRRFDVIYGYEAHGYLAASLLRFLGLAGGAKVVARFQGFKEKRGLMALFNWEMFLALMLPAHLCIITDDGTRGDRVLKSLGSPNLGRLRFWVNGVDLLPSPTPGELEETRHELGCPPGRFLAVSISRLVSWKRVDRGIRVIDRLVNCLGRKDVRYCIIGGGSEMARLSELVERLGLGHYVRMTGPVEHAQAVRYLQSADAFISTYDLSNVGNPLLEAIRSHKMIFTLDNGDTGRWIEHGVNGFIYPPDDGSIEAMARDLDRLISDRGLRRKVTREVRGTERLRLWTWGRRLSAELREVGWLAGGR